MYRLKKLAAVLVAAIMVVALLPCITASAEFTYSDFAFNESTGTITRYLGEGANVAIPDKINDKNVTAIGDYAFEGSRITGVSIPSTVKTIGKYAFSSCTSLRSAYIPTNVTSVGTGAFDGCRNLTIYASSSSTAGKYATTNGITRQNGTVSTSTLTFNANGGMVKPASKTVTRSFDYGELPIPTYSGYSFDGWYTSKSGGKEVTSTDTFTGTSSQTLYARWTRTNLPVVLTYQPVDITTTGVRLRGMVASGSNITAFTYELENLTTGEKRNISRPYPDGGYNLGAIYAGTLSTLAPGTHYRYRVSATNSYGTSYGEWVHFATLSNEVTCKVTFDVNGGSSLTSSERTKTVTVGRAYGTLPAPTRSGYTFTGWYTSASSGTQVTETTVVTNTADHTLYARWTKGSSVLPAAVTGTPEAAINGVVFYGTYNANGSTVTDYGFEVFRISSGKSALIGKNQVISNGSPTAFKVTFGNVAANELYRYRAYATSSAGTAYGEWVYFTDKGPAAYTVSFNVNGGTALPTSERTKTVNYGEAYGTLPVPTRSGYTFAGWFTAASGGTQVIASTIVETAANHTLYAHWTTGTSGGVPTATTGMPEVGTSANSIVLYGTYDDNGTVVNDYGFEIKRLSTGKSAEYLNSKGHTTIVSGTTYKTIANSVQSGEIYQYRAFAIYSGGKVYGEWIDFTDQGVVTYTVTFNANGGAVSPANKSVVVNMPYGELPAPTRSGYTFDGWYTALTGGTQVTAGTLVTTSGDHSLYAHWTQQVTLSAKLTLDSVSAAPGETVTVPVRISENPGISGFNMTISYDQTRLILTGVNKGSALSLGELTTSSIQQNPGHVTAEWSSSTAATGSGVILNLIFTVAENASGTVPVTAVANSAYGQQGDMITFEITDGAVYVVPASERDYTIVELTGEIPAEGGSFYAEATVTKNTDRDAKDTVVIAVYKDGGLVDMTYMKGKFERGQTVTFGGRLTAEPGSTVKAFVWDSLEGMQSLSDSLELGAAAAADAVVLETEQPADDASYVVELDI